jgi:hypothetical protein
MRHRRRSPMRRLARNGIAWWSRGTAAEASWAGRGCNARTTRARGATSLISDVTRRRG